MTLNDPDNCYFIYWVEGRETKIDPGCDSKIQQNETRKNRIL